LELNLILSKVDHTVLSQTAVWDEIKNCCDEGIEYHTASVCIPPTYVKRAKEYVGDRLTICTVIGFPNGYSTTAVKVFETEDAVKNGADEIDMVLNVGDLRGKRYNEIKAEIESVKAACRGRILKVIIETCLLTDDEKIKMCEIITDAKADYIKTSTGFSTAGASKDDVRLFTKHIGADVKIKASGGIRSLADAEDFIALGCSRLGTSSIVKLARQGTK
jgi:deoxyribose-phosphate aldolase